LYGYTPDKVLAMLKRGMGGMGGGGSTGSNGSSRGSGVLLSGATSRLLGGDAGDVKYPGYVINGRVRTAPHVFTGRRGQRVRIRILNAGGDTAFRVALGGHVMTVTHTDGRPCQPVRTRALLVGMAERYDVLVTLKDGVFPLVAYAEGKNATALAVVRTGAGPMPAPGARPAEQAGVLRGYRTLRPPESAAPPRKQADLVSRLELTGNMASYSWGFNGRTYPMGEEVIGPSYPRLVRVRQRQRLRVTWVNTTKMWHPMHIHGHTFQVNGDGPLKDTVNVLPDVALSPDDACAVVELPGLGGDRAAGRLPAGQLRAGRGREDKHRPGDRGRGSVVPGGRLSGVQQAGRPRYRDQRRHVVLGAAPAVPGRGVAGPAGDRSAAAARAAKLPGALTVRRLRRWPGRRRARGAGSGAAVGCWTPRTPS
jgi:hypothetical protein